MNIKRPEINMGELVGVVVCGRRCALRCGFSPPRGEGHEPPMHHSSIDNSFLGANNSSLSSPCGGDRRGRLGGGQVVLSELG